MLGRLVPFLPIDVPSAVPEQEGIEDHPETNLVNLCRVIYLTIMNALNYGEAVHYYGTTHRYEMNRLRDIARLFCHIANDAISWTVLQVIKMNEDDTTSSSQIFVKIMMEDVMESMGSYSQ